MISINSLEDEEKNEIILNCIKTINLNENSNLIFKNPYYDCRKLPKKFEFLINRFLEKIIQTSQKIEGIETFNDIIEKIHIILLTIMREDEEKKNSSSKQIAYKSSPINHSKNPLVDDTCLEMFESSPINNNKKPLANDTCSFPNTKFILVEISNLNLKRYSNLLDLVKNSFPENSTIISLADWFNQLPKENKNKNDIIEIKSIMESLEHNIKSDVKLTISLKKELIFKSNKNYILIAIETSNNGEDSIFFIYNLINFIDVKSFCDGEGDQGKNNTKRNDIIFNYIDNDFNRVIDFFRISLENINKFKKEIKYPTKKYKDDHGLLKSLILDVKDINSINIDSINNMGKTKLLIKLLVLSYILEYYQKNSLPVATKNEIDIHLNIVKPKNKSDLLDTYHELNNNNDNNNGIQAIVYKDFNEEIDINKKPTKNSNHFLGGTFRRNQMILPKNNFQNNNLLIINHNINQPQIVVQNNFFNFLNVNPYLNIMDNQNDNLMMIKSKFKYIQPPTKNSKQL
ncbi:hypothetical protein PIROE2DRAFT_4077 [Piromyces sp. E2]|nr:hypothetical protein PIROE2DRAFT_4077 [Piromyces sp. E2]|eukprot:OUM68321.1 hypothetical protein PIROE2DRAFT_4077 [Piromyces sp. E2]